MLMGRDLDVDWDEGHLVGLIARNRALERANRSTKTRGK